MDYRTLPTLASGDLPIDLSIPAKPLTGGECKTLSKWQEQAPPRIVALC
jgi:hypothetical protein